VHVLLVQSAYIRAAGSVLDRYPTSKGDLPRAPRPSDTSESRLLATDDASTTLQDDGPSIFGNFDTSILVVYQKIMRLGIFNQFDFIKKFFKSNLLCSLSLDWVIPSSKIFMVGL
jgi:hypothetical protein